VHLLVKREFYVIKMQATTIKKDNVIRYISTFFPSYILHGFILRRRQYLKLFSVGSTQVGINLRGSGQIAVTVFA